MGQDGLKKMRAGSNRRNETKAKPEYKCTNCGCMRYNPCGCEKSQMKKKKEEKAEK